ncbi:MAG TPA: DUF1800 family protein [Luteolibacter sp.]|nr:DUF1800 family protein [Luteolibacter sp.]
MILKKVFSVLFSAVAALGCQSWAGGFAQVWKLGADDQATPPFLQENFSANNAPGSAAVLDDDYYFAGTYPAPIGVLAADEPAANYERAVTSGDPRNRIHFPLTAAQASAHSRLRVTVDLFGGGGQSVQGFNSHDIAVRINGVLVGTRNAITWDDKIVMTVKASTVNAVAGANVVQIERSGGTANAWIQMDYLEFECDPTGLADADGDGLPQWFEETYGLSDADPSDAANDSDGDGLSNLQEFQKGTNPTAPDTDNDGSGDAQEISTDPLIADSDDDGLPDGEETTSNPTLADSDADGFPDNIEIESGTDPMSASSKPFDFPGAVGFQFVSEGLSSAKLKAGEPAGLLRFPHWNVSAPQPKWNAAPYVGSATALKNHRGQATAVAVNWSARNSTEGNHRGVSDEKLLAGMISAGMHGTTRTPAALTVSGISYPVYDLIVYVGHMYPDTPIRGFTQLGANAASRRYFSAGSNPPFVGWVEAKATVETASPPVANYVRYRGLSGASQTVALNQLTDSGISIHGFQIIYSGTDTDGDGLADSAEIEHGLNPAVADANADADGDGVSNAAEIAMGTHPHNPDTDGDGLRDGQEAAHNANPLIADTDGDGLTDGDEVLVTLFPSLANDADSDDDGFSDQIERRGGSDPKDAGSKPPGVPKWNGTDRTWTWVTKPVRVKWNHDQSMLGAIPGDETMICEAIVNRAGTGWDGRIALGIRYLNGRITYRFYCGFDVFYPQGAPSNGFWNSDWVTFPVDRTRDFGLSGFGTEDDSAPLSFEFTATRVNDTENRWTLVFKILNVTNPGSPVTIATWTQNNAVGAHASLLGGSTGWSDVNGNAGAMTLETEKGVRAFLGAGPLAPPDTDNDGMPDAWETANTFSVSDPSDAPLDADNDGLSNREEFKAGTNPRLADSDGDGAKDGVEILHGSNPLSASSVPLGYSLSATISDLDGDGLSDAWVLWSGGRHRNPNADDDGDGISNLKESIAGTNPDDGASKLEMRVAKQDDDLLLSWTDLPLKAHRVMSSTNLSAWSPATWLAGSSTSGGMRHATAEDFLSDGGTRFYAAEVSPLDTDGDGVEDWTEVNVLGSSITSANSLGQNLVRQNGQTLSGDALALQQRMSGSAANGGIAGSPTAGMPSPVQASRFLMQSTFGPVPEEIESVRTMGYEAWIDHQVGIQPTLLQPYIKSIKADAAGPRSDPTYNFNELDRFIHGNNVTTPFARAAIGGEDQLRQRVAFALSQILVVSRRDAQLEEKPEAMAHYYDLLIRHALGNYRDLLIDITFNPAMGWYLSHVGNQKGDPSVPRYPDENYAREVMQLFTIGLWELNPDGSRKLDVHGDPIPTYGNDEITEMASVFTGLYFDAPYGWNGGGWADEHYTKPMVMYPQHHDFGTKRLLKGFVLPESEETTANGIQDVRNAIDSLFRHPNTPPFVCRQLIQFLVTDNPSPGYVKRVQDVFVNDGSGTRGNLAAVVKAILLDAEARQLPISGSYGKAREPVVRTMHLGRLFKLAQTHPKFVWWNWQENFYGSSVQEPMNSPSVFNFYTPSYQAPGEIRDSGLVSPVLQIVNTYSAVSFPNLLLEYLHGGFRSAYNWWYPLDYSGVLQVSGSPEALVDQVDLLICAGNMTARTRSILLSKLADPALTAHDRAGLAVWLAMTCPEGAVQR